MLGLAHFENGNRLLEKSRGGGRLASLNLAPTPHRVIHTDNKTRVLFYEKNPNASCPEGKRRTPILIVPSLINRYYILDLMPGKSLIHFLCDRGFDVATIDWGVPGDEDRHVQFETFVDTYIGRSLAALAKETGVKKPVILGYCIGGTMAAIHAALNPHTVSGLIALTSPIDFHNTGLLSTWCKSPTFDVDRMVDTFGNIPWPLMQSTFECLRPTMNAARALTMIQRWRDKDFIDSSLALELWLGDNVSFPGECYRHLIKSFYKANGIMNGTFTMYEEPVDFTRLTCPILNVAASEDHIVPLDSTRALAKISRSEDYSELLTPGGHIGAIIGKKASAVLWPHMIHWMESRFLVEAPLAQPDRALFERTPRPPRRRRPLKLSVSAKVAQPLEAATEAPLIGKEPRTAEDAGVGGVQDVAKPRSRIRPWQAPLA